MEQIADYAHDTAENILWHPEENALYWLDIPAGQLFRGYFPDLKREALNEFHSECILQMDEAIGGFVFTTTPTTSCEVSFLLFASQGHIYEWQYSGQDKPPKPKLYAQTDQVPIRFNDVFAWPSPSAERLVLCGTMPTEGNTDSRLLLFDTKTRKTKVLLENLKLANGMALSPDRNYFYFADTRDFGVYRFALPQSKASPTQIDWQAPHKLIDFAARAGRPDGLCVDTEGRIWLAETGAGQITCFSAQGQELTHLAVGTPKITSCCFGGSSQDILFISTQGGDPKDSKAPQAPKDPKVEKRKAGGIFAQKLKEIEQNLPGKRIGQEEFLL